MLGSCRLRCEGLLGHHRSPSGVTHSTGVRGLNLGLAGHPQGLLGHVWYRGLSRVGVMLWWERTGGYLGHWAPWQVDLRTRDHVRLRGRGHLWVQGGVNGLARRGHVVL